MKPRAKTNQTRKKNQNELNQTEQWVKAGVRRGCDCWGQAGQRHPGSRGLGDLTRSLVWKGLCPLQLVRQHYPRTPVRDYVPRGKNPEGVATPS